MSRLLLAAAMTATFPPASFPGPGTTGADLTGITLTSVPAQATSGPGWTWSSAGGYAQITGAGATFSGYAIPAGGIYVKAPGVTVENCSVGGSYGIYVQSAGDSATISNCVVVTPGGGNACIAFEAGTQYGTVENCTLSGTGAGAGRITSGVVSNSADPLFTMTGCDVSWCKNCFENAQNPAGIINVSITGNYMHDLGFVALDHTDTLYLSYGIGGVISGNTLYNQLAESNVLLGTAMNPVPLAVTGNLLAGAGYTVQAGGPTGHITYSGPMQNLTFTGNFFSTLYYPDSGVYGPVENWGVPANTWSGNCWLDGPLAGQEIPEPAGDYTYQAPPAVPASGTPLANPFGVPCTVVVTAPAGCTLTAVTPTPNTVLIPPAGAASQVLVPGASMTAGASITLTYSGTTPTWTWTS